MLHDALLYNIFNVSHTLQMKKTIGNAKVKYQPISVGTGRIYHFARRLIVVFALRSRIDIARLWWLPNFVVAFVKARWDAATWWPSLWGHNIFFNFKLKFFSPVFFLCNFLPLSFINFFCVNFFTPLSICEGKQRKKNLFNDG